jgi:hypothetical protein
LAECNTICVSRILSAPEFITGQSIDNHGHCQLSFGTYVQVAEDHDIRVELPRTCGAIALHPTGNAQGAWYFYSLKTGRRITGYQWTELPMPAEVVDVHALARRDYTLAGLVVVDRTGDVLDGDEDHDDDISFGPEAEEDVDDDADLAAALHPVPSDTLAGVDGDDIDYHDDDDINDDRSMADDNESVPESQRQEPQQGNEQPHENVGL